MLGALSAGSDIEYVGCEPDIQTYKALLTMLQDKAIPESVRHRAIIFGEPAEIAMAKIHQEEKFDLVLTSPPYFNMELYTSGEQSTNKYKTWDDWSEKWLKAIILGCLAALKPGGTSCWSVKNFKSDKNYPLADITKKIHKDAGWELVKTVPMIGSGRPGGKRIQGGKEKRRSNEETLCFKKGK
jgi:hypothetical protein